MKNIYSIIFLSGILVFFSACTSDNPNKVEVGQNVSSSEVKKEAKSEKFLVESKEILVEKKTEIPELKKEAITQPYPNLFLYTLAVSNKVRVSDIGRGRVSGGDKFINEINLWYKSSKDNGKLTLRNGTLESLFCKNLANISFYENNPDEMKIVPLFSSTKGIKNLFVLVIKVGDKLEFYSADVSFAKNKNVVLLNSSGTNVKIATQDEEYLIKAGESMPVEITNNVFNVRVDVSKTDSGKFRSVFSGTVEVPVGTKVMLLSIVNEESGDVNFQPILFN